jgi:hypothetical protein
MAAFVRRSETPCIASTRSARHARLHPSVTTGAIQGQTAPPLLSRKSLFVLESAQEDNDWDVVAARELFPDERACSTGLDELARERGVCATTLMRQILGAGVAELDSTAAVSLADVQRAIASLARPACAQGPEPENH